VDPSHAICARLRSGHVERAGGRVHADHAETAFGQDQRERARPAADIEDLAGAELVRDVCVDLEITAVAIERVIDGGKPRMLEVVVSHGSSAGGQAGFCQTEMCEVLSLENGVRVQSPQRSRSRIPARRAIRSSSDGHT